MSVYKPITGKKYEIENFKKNKYNKHQPLFYIEATDATHEPGYRFYTEDEALGFAKKQGFL